MKVLITTPTFPPYNSGLGNAAMCQAKALVSLGMEVVVATGGPERSSRSDEGGWRIEEFDVSGADSLVNPIRGDAGAYREFLQGAKFDVVLMNAWQTWSTDICLRHMAEIPGKKILYSHCLSTNVFFKHTPVRSLVRYLLWRPYYYRLRTVLRKLDAMIALAQDGCDSRFDDLRMAKAAGVPVYIVPNALSEPASAGLDAESVPRDCRDQLISVGSYEWQKGHDFVLRAYSMSSARNVIPLKIFGQKFTAYTDWLRRLAGELGIEASFLQFHEGLSGQELFDEYGRSLAFLYGSHTECQPLVILDAMAAGTPFVSRSSGCIDALPGGSGVASEASAAMKLNEVLADRSIWEGYSAAGRQAARTFHHPKEVGRKLVSVLREILGKPDVRPIRGVSRGDASN